MKEYSSLVEAVKNQSAMSMKLEPQVASPELRMIRDEVERATFDEVRLKTGFRGTEVEHCLGYVAFMQWVSSVFYEKDPKARLVSDSARTHALRIVQRVATKQALVEEIRKLEPSFEPNGELELGHLKSSSPLWMHSTTRGVVITTRRLAFSISDHLGVSEHMTFSVSPSFAVKFLSLSSKKHIEILEEWVDAVLGDLAKGFF